MDLVTEYEEIRTVPAHIAVAYKFFVPFRIENGDLMWGEHAAGADEDAIPPIKTFLKTMKAALREGKLSRAECSRRMWFWYAKIIDLGLFKHEARVEIIQWMEVCELVIP